MAELSFIIHCDNKSDQIERCVNSVFDAFDHYADYEVVIINCATEPNITDILARLERKYSKQLMLVNCEEFVSENDSFNIGLGYAKGACFLKLSPEDILDCNTMKGVVYDASVIDENYFKYLHDKYIYIVQSKGNLCFKCKDQNKSEYCDLGRYEDQQDYLGWKKRLDSIISVLEKSEYLYLSTPVGCNERMFDAYRIFYPLTIINGAEGMILQEFTLLHEGERTTFDFSHEEDNEKIRETLEYARNVLMGDFDCGVFVFRKA